ncbi:MAG: hypothetical protein HKP52_05765 [Desulfofustis sp.]|nr:hypothetical protein [Desulfofustis sp.]MBT8347160.1 hypothetical protein [Desulfofustis sp.]MBT8353352.1 hypothetical protein [Desulfofustis sp.]NNF46900.1 hypothetical protein [Desulfofustis sp.]NNK13725.1 hypothetical protein [Desulfofustis sp.]
MGHERLRIGIGIVLCMSGIMLINKNRWFFGLACFVGGFLVLMKGKFRR